MMSNRLGDYIIPCDERNTNLEIKLFQGISTEKVFTNPKQVAENIKNTKIVRTGQFAYNRATTRNGEKISIAYREGPDCVVSSAYQVFKIRDETVLDPKYLMMFFNRSEFDRYARYMSKGSAHEFFDYEDMCNVEITIPDIETQRNVVAIFDNLKNKIGLLEKRVSQLKIAFQIYIENLKKKYKPQKISDYIFLKNKRNKDCAITGVCGVCKDKLFIPTIANMKGIKIDNYKIVEPGDFAYSNRINVGSIALRYETPCVVSPSYTVFGVKKQLNPEYLLMWLCRDEFLHFAFFYSIGTVKDDLSYDELGNLKIPLPNPTIQMYAVNIFREYFNGKKKIESLKALVKNICPVLIRGSVMSTHGGN